MQTHETFHQIDDQLDQLVDITGTANQNARRIGGVLDDQTAVIGNVNNHMDTTNEGINSLVGSLKELQKQKGTCTAWIMAILFLLIGIIGGPVLFIVIK